jgi:hypothetical protein
VFPPVSSIEKGGEHGSCTYICEKLFRADADFLSVVISDTKGNLSEIFSFFCQRARDHRAGTAAFGLCGRNEKRRGKSLLKSIKLIIQLQWAKRIKN